MRTLTAQIAGRALTLAMTATIAGAVGAEACSAIVPDSLPSLFCQPDDETPSETCPSGQTCGVAGQCVPVPACASGDPCPGDASAEGAIDTLPDGADAALPDGSGDSLGDDSGDDGGGDALTCDPLREERSDAHARPKINAAATLLTACLRSSTPVGTTRVAMR
jgi:hypothetical protein